MENGLAAAKTKKRIEYFDIAKGIAILCIIAGHMGIGKINKVMYPFHVPIFFLISGYFLSGKGTFRDFLKKRFRTLIIPYLFTGVCLVLMKIPVDIVLGRPEKIGADMSATALSAAYGSGYNNPTLFGIRPIGAIWFLWALFWALVFVRIILEFRQDNIGFAENSRLVREWIVIALIFGVSYVSSKYIWLPWNIQAGGCACLFVYLGMRLRERQFFEKCSAWWLMIGGLAALALEYYFRINVNMVANYYKYGIVSIIGAFLISLGVIGLSRKIERWNGMKRVLLFYGENSLIILCFHLIELNNAPWWVIYNVLEGWNVPYILQVVCVFGLKVAFSTVCTCIVLRVPILRKIFGNCSETVRCRL